VQMVKEIERHYSTQISLLPEVISSLLG